MTANVQAKEASNISIFLFVLCILCKSSIGIIMYLSAFGSEKLYM